MMQIRPVTDLRNKFTEIESFLKGGEPIYLTKNGYGTAVIMSLEKYSELTDDVELLLDEADRVAEESDVRYTHEEFMSQMLGILNDEEI